MNPITGIKKLAVYGALLGGVSAATLGLGSGLAQAEPAVPSTSGHHFAAYAREDQEVVPRDHPIPVHGDDDHAAPPAAATHTSATHRGK